MSGKNILVTGANGMLGSSLIKNLSYNNIVSSDLDVTDSKSVANYLSKNKPDIIIHTAAYTNVDNCESNPDKAYKINSIGTQNLVNYCVDKDILFIYISSTGIYGTEKENGPYNEFDNVNPTTIHHKSKYEAEKIVQNHLNKYLILRTGWLFGGDITHNKNFVYKRYLEARNNKIMYSDDIQKGNPTYVLDFVKQMEVLIQNNQLGIFNCVNKAINISRYDYVKKIIELFDINCQLKVASKDMFKRVAPVSHNESAINYKLDLLGLNVMNDWQKALEKYILELKREIDG
jgi:dTDP-4-dehydrorhamnose reductase